MTARIRYLRHRELDGLERGRLRHTKRKLRNGLEAAVKIYDCYPDNLNNQIEIPSLSDYLGDTPRVMLSGSLPAELEHGKIYYLSYVSDFTFKLYEDKSLTQEVQFSDDGVAPITIYILDPIEEVGAV